MKITTLIIVLAGLILSSCGASKPYHACGITELNKQYKAKTKY